MAIAYDTSISYHSAANSTSHTWSHTCTGSDRILWVHVMNASSVSISSVTYNGVALSLAVGSTTTQRSRLYYLIAPTTGANNIVVTLASSSYCYANSASYTGADQVTQPDATGTTNTASSPINTSVTIVTSDSWCVLGARNASSGDTDASTNSTERQADAGYAQLYDSNGGKAAGSFTMTLTSGAGTVGTSMASFKPASGGGGSATPTRMLMGMGQ